MLEALIRITDAPKHSTKAKGDIVAVKLSPAVWGNLERKQFLIAKIEDAALEAALTVQRNAGESFPVISNPYAKYETVQGVEVPAVSSAKFINPDMITKIPQSDIKDPTKDKPILEKTDVLVETRPDKVTK